MTKLIDNSEKIDHVKIGTTWGGDLIIKTRFQWKEKPYTLRDIEHIEEVDIDEYRSLGKSAVGAIIGGVLTGGIGLLAGAAIGGRRRTTATFIVIFRDGEFVTFEEKDRTYVKLLKEECIKRKTKNTIQAIQNRQS